MPKINIGEKILINGAEYTCSSDQLGSNSGGFFKNNDGKEFYIKYVPVTERRKVDNEVLALKLYSLYNIPVPVVSKGTLTYKDKDYIAIITEKAEITALADSKDLLTAESSPFSSKKSLKN